MMLGSHLTINKLHFETEAADMTELRLYFYSNLYYSAKFIKCAQSQALVTQRSRVNIFDRGSNTSRLFG